MKKIKETALILVCLCFLFPGNVLANSKPSGVPIVIKAGTSYKIAIGNTGKKVKWRSSKRKVASVNSKGKVKGKRKGTAVITAKVGKKVYAWKVIVEQSVKKITVNNKKFTLIGNGASVQIKAKVYPKNANDKSLTWTSSNTKVATVNHKGKVTAVGNGRCYIYVKTNDGSNKRSKVTVIVKKVTVTKKTEVTSKVSVPEKEQVQAATASEKTEDILFDLSLFQDTVIINDNAVCSLFILNLKPVNPNEVTFMFAGAETLEIKNFIQREKEINPYGFASGKAYYIGGWEKRIAYVEAGYNPNGYAPFRIDIYPFLSQGSFTIEVYYQGKLITKSKVYMNAIDPGWILTDRYVQNCENMSWDNSMSKKEKMDSLAEYIKSNKTYSEVDCKNGAQIMYCAAMDLGLEAYISFENSSAVSFDYRNLGNPLGHTWCVIIFEGGDTRYDVQGFA